MELKVVASAGTLESSDIQIIIEPSTAGIEITLESTVMAQFGEEIELVIKETLNSLGVLNGKVFANDKGAINPVIKSRVQTAVYRSAQNNDYKWM
ncbi:MAG: citrate lyase acyl carrier protein [Clostridium sp.]|uniref:citrate lyase acyl carrier protein n=1 Tax=Clostridium sp. TaxID=1506 RepID=UPI00302D83B1